MRFKSKKSKKTHFSRIILLSSTLWHSSIPPGLQFSSYRPCCLSSEVPIEEYFSLLGNAGVLKQKDAVYEAMNPYGQSQKNAASVSDDYSRFATAWERFKQVVSTAIKDNKVIACTLSEAELKSSAILSFILYLLNTSDEYLEKIVRTPMWKEVLERMFIKELNSVLGKKAFLLPALLRPPVLPSLVTPVLKPTCSGIPPGRPAPGIPPGRPAPGVPPVRLSVGSPAGLKSLTVRSSVGSRDGKESLEYLDSKESSKFPDYDRLSCHMGVPRRKTVRPVARPLDNGLAPNTSMSLAQDQVVEPIGDLIPIITNPNKRSNSVLLMSTSKEEKKKKKKKKEEEETSKKVATVKRLR